MDLIEWYPFREMGRELTDVFGRTPFRYFGEFRTPRVDVYQTDSDVIVKAEIPGVSKEDLNLYVYNDSIRLSGQFRKSDEFKDENVYRAERQYGGFSRVIPMPVEVKSEEARAEYKDGILTVTIPKVEPAKTKGRRIDIH